VVFDHVAIAVSNLAASERFYRTVLSVLGVEPSHADAEPSGRTGTSGPRTASTP
jgi:catechol 2,3-dioxygenase-like lactoylglutathione lyase family enzyme